MTLLSRNRSGERLRTLARIWLLLTCMALASVRVNHAQTPLIASLPQTTRADIVARAKKMAAHTWLCGSANLRAACSRAYKSDWNSGQRVTGIPYRWGGVDGPEAFEQKLTEGLAAGSHSRYGVLSCATGIDCSGFVCLAWGLPLSGHAYSTGSLRQIAGKPKYNWFTDMKPGDVFDKPGSHVVLFVGYMPDGMINVCEASGSAARVICHATTWSRLKGYIPLQYKGIDE